MFETLGMANFYQGDRMGVYKMTGSSSAGKTTYKQVNGDNYLFYLENRGVWHLIIFLRNDQMTNNCTFKYWMIGYNVGVDKGGLMNTGDSGCPENLSPRWLYYNDLINVSHIYKCFSMKL